MQQYVTPELVKRAMQARKRLGKRTFTYFLITRTKKGVFRKKVRRHFIFKGWSKN